MWRPASFPVSNFRLPRTKVVDRIDFLVEICRGKRVIHAGFWGTEGIRENAVTSGLWLHERLAAAARELVGVDVNQQGVEEARKQGYEAFAADLADPRSIAELGLSAADVLVAGELIEHLDNPGEFLATVHSLVAPSGTMVITTPNATCLSSTIRAVLGREAINPDHVALYSWYTLTNVLRRHGWVTTWFGAYRYPRGRSFRSNLLFAVYGLATAISPFVSHGLIAVCQQEGSSSAGRSD